MARPAFAGLSSGLPFNETFGTNVFTFAIDYQGGDGNDITLRVSNIAPALASGVKASLDDGAATGPDAIIDPAADVVLIGVLPDDLAMYPVWGG